MKSTTLGALCAGLMLSSVLTTAHAVPVSGQGTWETTLQSRSFDGGATIGGYYDTALNITWLADTFAANTGMDWYGATRWVGTLNFNGITGWTLPIMTDPTVICTSTSYSGQPCGYNNPATSQLAHMFYTTLGDKAYYDTAGNPQGGYGPTNTGPFANVLSRAYWSATTYKLSSAYAWTFGMGIGFQSYDGKSDILYAWAVHAGDVGASAVPLPAAVWLFGSGLLGLLGVSGKRRR